AVSSDQVELTIYRLAVGLGNCNPIHLVAKGAGTDGYEMVLSGIVLLSQTRKMQGVLEGWTAFLWVTAMIEALHVMVPEKKQVAMLFQPVVLQCHFSTSSTQPAVVQWKFKSYCQDRMGDALGVVSAGIQAVNKRNPEWDPYVDCVDSRRTVRIVASKQGPTVTIGEFYKGRDVTIVHGNPT
ncbi:Immunoglobulin-like domain-containing receptor 2, partial [Varanus komodoensis]